MGALSGMPPGAAGGLCRALDKNMQYILPQQASKGGKSADKAEETPPRRRTQSMTQEIEYSEKYNDGEYEYRHVILPKHIAKNAPKGRMLAESEWRGIGVQQSRGWVHYMIHRPEPHILLMRRPLGTDPVTGLAPAR